MSTILELRVELNEDLALYQESLKEMMGRDEYFAFLEDVVRKAIDDKWLEEVPLEDLEAEVASYPQEVQDKADEILRAFGIALGEARAEWCERVMNGEDLPVFIDDIEGLKKDR